MSEWQPIETAPKDGRELVFLMNWTEKPRSVVAFWDERAESFWTGECPLFEEHMIGWYALPAPNG